jgi:hypothetical protein
MGAVVAGLAVAVLSFEAQHAMIAPGASRTGPLLISAALGACVTGALWLARRRGR